MSVDKSSDLQDVFTKVDKIKKLWDNGTMDFDLIRYLSGVAKKSRQGQIYNALPKKAHASPNWLNKFTFEFNLILAANTVTNFNNMHICTSTQIKNDLCC